MTDSENRFLFADWWGDPGNTYRVPDDINNNFGGAGVDANWSPTPGEWFWLEVEIDAVEAGSSLGSYRSWINGDLYIELTNYNVSESPTDLLFKILEFGGHVYQNGAPAADTYVETHSFALFPERPGVPQGL